MKNRSIPSVVVNSGTTSNILKPADSYTPTGKQSNKQYTMATGNVIPGGDEAFIGHEL